MDEHRRDKAERKLPPAPYRGEDRDRPWGREDFLRDLRRITRRKAEQAKP